MPINPDAVGAVGEAAESSWNSKDCLLYALGVGAGVTDPTGFELEFTTENSNGIVQKALPTMAVVLGGGGGPLGAIGSFDMTMLVHGEQAIKLHKPIPVEATIESQGRIAGIYDKGKAALVVTESTATDKADGQPLFTSTSSLFIRGEGGWGGDRGPSSSGGDRPETEPDQVVSYNTRTDQALLYRLNGDRNPLHSDPTFAAAAGFDKPILHGLCTYGFSGRGLLHGLCDGDPSRFGAMSGRFSSPVMPGETLDIRIWPNESGAHFQTCVGDRVVFDNGLFEFA
jgi:acyl dehydratase